MAMEFLTVEFIKVETEEERQSLEHFKVLTKDLHQDPATLLRFLRARCYNLQKADEMLRKCLEWRKNNKMNTILEWDRPTWLVDALPFEYRGLDNKGSPVAWIPLGRWRGRPLIERGQKEDCLRSAFYMFELCLYHVKRTGNRPCFVIFGMEGLSLNQVSHFETMNTFFDGFQQLEKNFPEMVRKLYIINAPWVFSTAFAFIKPVMSARTLAKIEVHGSDKRKWLPLLMDSMPTSTIPAEYLDDKK